MSAQELLGSRPDLAQGWARMQEAVDAAGLDPALLTWARQRARWMVGLDVPAGVPEVPAPDAALADFIEQFLMDVHGVTDAQAEVARGQLGDGGLVALVVALGTAESHARMELMLR